MPSATSVEYQRDQGLSPFNLYRASIEVLATTGLYTQDPLAVPEAERFCGEASGTLVDAFELPPGGVIDCLGTGIDGLGQETALGMDSAGAPRPNDHPCP